MIEVPATRQDDVVDVLHGESVADPYRWLEDTDSAETAAWVKEQNAVTTEYLESLPDREQIRARLAELWDVTKYGVPYVHGGKWFFTRHDAGSDQPVLRVSDSPDDDGTVLLDPNTLSGDGTVALVSWTVNSDGTRLVYATSSAGSDWMTWRVRDVETGDDLDDVVEWAKWSDAAWLPDSSGFFYGALDAPTEGREYLDPSDGLRLQLHLLGTSQVDDELVYADPNPQWEPDVKTIGAGRWLIVTMHHGTYPEKLIKILDLHDPASGLRDLIATPDTNSHVVGCVGDTFLVLTDADAARKRVVAIDIGATGRDDWREVIPEGSDTLVDVTQVGDHLVAHVLQDASSQLQLWTATGEFAGDAAMPAHISITELSGGPDSPLAHVGVTSFTDPASVWACDVTSGQTTRVRESQLPIDVGTIAVTRALAQSSDGTPVPMFIVHRQDVTPTGDVPAMLWGYGGYEIPITPTFNAGRLVWVERGGLLAVANLRGGGEFGKEWYDAGRLERKQNVFNDFAGCARWLAESGWSRAEKIVINGGSNGGLLVGALLTQHPELIGAAIPEVGVLDMLRFHKFTIGWAWTSDYGDPDDPEQFGWLRAYSPLHAIKAGTAYPATLILTGDHDDRVVPGHSFKFAAALQHGQRGAAPVLIRVETAAGHGMGTPVSKLIEARADVLAFAEAATG